MAYTAEILASSIVILGDFNPAIFTPDWLENHALIGKDDAAIAQEGTQERAMLVSHNVTTLDTDWFALDVLGNSFTLTSQGVFTPAFKDLAVGIFSLYSIPLSRPWG